MSEVTLEQFKGNLCMLCLKNKLNKKPLIHAPEKSMESWNLEMLEGPAHSNLSFDLQEVCSVSAAFFNQMSIGVSHPKKKLI